MTRALVTQLVDTLDRMGGWLNVRHLCGLMPDEIALIKAAREYLATEPSGERAELVEKLRAKHDERFVVSPSIYTKAADMLEADVSLINEGNKAQQAKRVPDLKTGQHEPISHSGADEVPPIFGRRWRLARDGFGLQRDDESGNYVQINDAISTMHAILEASKEDKRVPMTGEEIAEIALDFCLPQSTRSFARAIEAHHGITPADKPIGDEPEDLYALALKADNWGQP